MVTPIRPKVALDIDDVIAGFWPGITGKEFNINPFNQWDPNSGPGKELTMSLKASGSELHDKYNSSDFWKYLNPICNPGIVHALGDFLECYITSRPEVARQVTYQWLERNMFPPRPVIFASNKAKAMEVFGCNALVDDKPNTIRAVQEAGMKGFLFKPFYNNVDYDENEFTVIQSLMDKPFADFIGEYIQHQNKQQAEAQRRAMTAQNLTIN